MASQNYIIDKKEVLSKLNSNIESYLKYIAPEGKIKGNNYLLLNPNRSDETLGSFVVDLQTGMWQDFADKTAKGKDLINLTMFLLSVDFYTALKYANTYLNGDIVNVAKSTLTTKKENTEYTFISCTNSNLPLNHTYHNHKPVKTYIYTDSDGFAQVLLHRYSIDGKKAFLQQSYVSPGQWVLKTKPNNRPLYNLPALLSNKAKPVLIVEGEKAVEALQPLLSSFLVTTTLGGANAPLLSNLNVLAGRKVYIWADNDNAGKDYQDKLVGALKEMVAELFTLDIKKLGNVAEGYDGADYVVEHTQAELTALMTQFEPVVISAETEIRGLLFENALIKTIMHSDEGYASREVMKYAKSKDEAIKYGLEFAINDALYNRAIILNVQDHRTTSKNNFTDSFLQVKGLPKPHYIIHKDNTDIYQYVYILDKPVYTSKNANKSVIRFYKRVCYALSKKAEDKQQSIKFNGGCVVEVESRLILNPFAEKTRFIRNDIEKYSLTDLYQVYDVEKDNTHDNNLLFTHLRHIAYRLVNNCKVSAYTNNFKAELAKSAEQLVDRLNLKVSEQELKNTVHSVAYFAEHNKENFENKKYILSKSIGNVDFELMNSKERMQAGAKYTASKKRHKTSMAILLSIKYIRTKKTQKDIAEDVGITDSNICKHYKEMFNNAMTNKMNELAQDEFLMISASQTTTKKCIVLDDTLDNSDYETDYETDDEDEFDRSDLY